MDNRLVGTSKFLSLVLRHQPEVIGLSLDAEGWVNVDELLAACREHGKEITRTILEEVVATNDKKRFAFSDDQRRIRANQGHSVDVDLNLESKSPPEFLYHGTVERFLESIRRHGLVRGKRGHVHLSPDRQTAKQVGSRRGKPVILIVAAERMHRDGHSFYLSDNGVWLTAAVPADYLRFPTSA
jgi:putative RNA 2'-phosphotransferase